MYHNKNTHFHSHFRHLLRTMSPFSQSSLPFHLLSSYMISPYTSPQSIPNLMTPYFLYVSVFPLYFSSVIYLHCHILKFALT